MGPELVMHCSRSHVCRLNVQDARSCTDQIHTLNLQQWVCLQSHVSVFMCHTQCMTHTGNVETPQSKHKSRPAMQSQYSSTHLWKVPLVLYNSVVCCHGILCFCKTSAAKIAVEPSDRKTDRHLLDVLFAQTSSRSHSKGFQQICEPETCSVDLDVQWSCWPLTVATKQYIASKKGQIQNWQANPLVAQTATYDSAETSRSEQLT